MERIITPGMKYSRLHDESRYIKVFSLYSLIKAVHYLIKPIILSFYSSDTRGLMTSVSLSLHLGLKPLNVSRAYGEVLNKYRKNTSPKQKVPSNETLSQEKSGSTL